MAIKEVGSLYSCFGITRRVLSYSPQLNPVERFWKHLRRKVKHNAFFQAIDRLLDAVSGFFQVLTVLPDIVCSVAGLAA
jgi:hypothetical protein